MVTGTAEKTNQDTGKAQGEPKDLSVPAPGLERKEGSTKTEKTYTQSEVDALVGKAGQRLKANLDSVTTERDTLKSQVETLTAEITEAKQSIASLTEDIEAMSEDDPDKDRLKKLRKEREKELQTLKAERTAIAQDKTEITTWKRDQLVYSVADEYVTADGKDVDPDSFKNAADKLRLNERDGLVILAETMGLKLKGDESELPKTETPPLKLLSGKTNGGGIDLNGLSPKELLNRAYSKKK